MIVRNNGKNVHVRYEAISRKRYEWVGLLEGDVNNMISLK